MPFIRKNFCPAAGTSVAPLAPALHTYRTPDTHLDVDTTGYFNEIRDILSIGDLIYVAVTNAAGTVIVSAGHHVVLTKTATTVDVTNVTALVLTNTD